MVIFRLELAVTDLGTTVHVSPRSPWWSGIRFIKSEELGDGLIWLYAIIACETINCEKNPQNVNNKVITHAINRSITLKRWISSVPGPKGERQRRVSHSTRSESKKSVLDIARQLCFPPLWRTLGQVQWWYGGPAMLQRGGSPGGSKSPDTFFSKGQMRIKPSSQNPGVIDGILWYWPRFVGIVPIFLVGLVHQNPRLPDAHAHLRLWPGRILRRVGHVFILWDRRSSHPWSFCKPKWVEKYGQKPTIPWLIQCSILPATVRVSPIFIIFRQSLTTPNMAGPTIVLCLYLSFTLHNFRRVPGPGPGQRGRPRCSVQAIGLGPHRLKIGYP